MTDNIYYPTLYDIDSIALSLILSELSDEVATVESHIIDFCITKTYDKDGSHMIQLEIDYYPTSRASTPEMWDELMKNDFESE